MEKKILQFSDLLRRAGLRVTLAETMDSLEALKLVEFNKEAFYTALKATLVKDTAYFPVFDRLFAYYFKGDFFMHRENWECLHLQGYLGENPMGDLEAGLLTCDGDKSAGSQGSRRGGEPGQYFAHIIRLGSPEDAETFLDEGIQALGSLQEKHLYQKEEALREIKVFLEWKMGEYQLDKQSCQVDEKSKILWQERINSLEARLREKLEEKLLARFGDEALEEILTRTNLNTLDFYQLSQNQVEEIKKKVTKLAHKLAAKVSLGRERSKRGEINLQRTIRKSMATGGIPLHTAFQQKKPSKPELMVLCDISGSVATFSEFMLQFVYSVQARFLTTRSFVFVDTIAEATEYFRGREVEEGIKAIYNQAQFSKTGFSDYGQVLKEFNGKFLPQVTRKTSILILGDARNNYRPHQGEEMEKIAKAAKKVIWLNPEPAERWNREDSIIEYYGNICNQLYPCRNLEQLEKAIKLIF